MYLSLRRCACASSPFTLQPSALLHLETFRSVHMDPNTLRDVIPSRLSRLLLGYADVVPLQAIAVRPVQGVSLSLISGHGYRALEVLART